MKRLSKASPVLISLFLCTAAWSGVASPDDLVTLKDALRADYLADIYSVTLQQSRSPYQAYQAKDFQGWDSVSIRSDGKDGFTMVWGANFHETSHEPIESIEPRDKDVWTIVSKREGSEERRRAFLMKDRSGRWQLLTAEYDSNIRDAKPVRLVKQEAPFDPIFNRILAGKYRDAKNRLYVFKKDGTVEWQGQKKMFSVARDVIEQRFDYIEVWNQKDDRTSYAFQWKDNTLELRRVSESNNEAWQTESKPFLVLTKQPDAATGRL